MPKATIIGSGNVAWAMAIRLFSQDWTIQEICARNADSGKDLSRKVSAQYVSFPEKIDPNVNVIIIAVSDDAIKKVANQLPNTKALVLHCSGSTPLASLPQRYRGVIWPLRSIARGQHLSWSNLNIVVEADTDIASVRCLDLISALGARPVQMDSKERMTAHLVAVILNNFSNHLLHMADVLCDEKGMDRRIFQDLMAHTLDYKGAAIESQTGPAARKDMKIIKQQLALMKGHPDFQEVYNVLTKSIIKSVDEQEL
jgi:predicted short-subunit dehydrogenase-like oxidoreductase (DUF2520 family)